tara:strand:+ start:889 stop:1167 length:279 start_codon:yes stop_codon:yes gene_type:complete
MSEWTLEACNYSYYPGRPGPFVVIRARFDRPNGESEPDTACVQITISDLVRIHDPFDVGKYDECLEAGLALAEKNRAVYSAHKILQVIAYRS